METRILRVTYRDTVYNSAFHCNLNKKPDITFENEFSFGERYIVWPPNPQAKPKLRGRFCTFRSVSTRSGEPRATVLFEDDGSQATVELHDLLSEEQYKMLTNA